MHPRVDPHLPISSSCRGEGQDPHCQVYRRHLKLRSRRSCSSTLPRLFLGHCDISRLSNLASSILAQINFEWHPPLLLDIRDFRHSISAFIDRDVEHHPPCHCRVLYFSASYLASLPRLAKIGDLWGKSSVPIEDGLGKNGMNQLSEKLKIAVAQEQPRKCRR